MSREATARAKREAGSPTGEPVGSAARARVRSQRKAVAREEKRDPLRRRLLAALAGSPAVPRELSKRVGSPGPSVSRALKDLREAGLVGSEGDDPADRRRVRYYLTEAGETQLNRFYAFGAPKDDVPPAPTDEQARELLRSAIDRAVRIRREANRLGEATDRLQGVIREAEKIGAHDLALEAMVELAKTVRQNRRPDKQDELRECQEGLIDRLNAIALGNLPAYGAEFALPAAAHLKYTLGRSGEQRGEVLSTREAHLTAACSLYWQLVGNSETPASLEWFRRQTWSVISLAGNLRKQTRLERALRLATVAKRGFDSLEDAYGQAQCLFMFGFCLRLLGEFREASACLDRAYRLAEDNCFERARADTLMQMGEVRRCLGELDEARDFLNEALGLADGMRLLVTGAFAQSALGAVEFQKEEYGEAHRYLEGAALMFDACEHVEGAALNARRRAAVMRSIAADSRKPTYAEAERLIGSADEGYRGLQSPAGVAACAVEEGRVRMLRKRGRVGPVVERLRDLLSSRGQCEILELDPWVPQLLHRFAQDVDDADLVARSETVVREAREILAERGAESVERVAEVVDDLEVEDEGEIDVRSAEMGGEARRDPSAFGEPGLLWEDLAGAGSHPAAA